MDKDEQKENIYKKNNRLKKNFIKLKIYFQKRREQEKNIPSKKRFIIEILGIFLALYCQTGQVIPQITFIRNHNA